MGFEVLYPNGGDAALWQHCVDSLPDDRRDVLLTPAYARVQAEVANTSAVCLLWRWDNAIIMQPTLLRSVTQGADSSYDLASFYGGGGPVANIPMSLSAREGMDKAAADWRMRSHVVCEYSQLMLPATLGVHQDFLLRKYDVSETTHAKDAVLVPLGHDDERLLASFSRNRRREVEAAREAGVMVAVIDPSRQALDRFHSLYREGMYRLGADKRWWYPERAWGAYAKHLWPDHMSLLAVGHGMGIDSMLLLVHGYGRCYAHFIGGYKHHALLYYEAMRHARAIGCATFFLGGGTTDADDDSHLVYKLSFSKKTVPVRVYKRVFDDSAYTAACQKVGIEPVLIKDASDKWRVDTQHHGFFPGYRAREAA